MRVDFVEHAKPARAVARSLDWEPFWLGPPGRRLYAGLHCAMPNRAGLGLVLAPPLLAEQPRSRRLLFEIAGEFASQGLPCLRFDYYGTGDSDGPGEAHDLRAMHADLDAAVAGLRERAGVTRIAVMAWRGGALAACDWARRRRVDALVLWDPVENGAAWLRELEAADGRERVSPDRYPHGAGSAPGDGQLMGYPVSSTWRRDIGALRLADTASVLHTRLWAVLRSAGPAPDWAHRSFVLPRGTPQFEGDTRMDATLFLSPALRAMIGDLGRELQDAER